MKGFHFAKNNHLPCGSTEGWFWLPEEHRVQLDQGASLHSTTEATKEDGRWWFGEFRDVMPGFGLWRPMAAKVVYAVMIALIPKHHTGEHTASKRLLSFLCPILECSVGFFLFDEEFWIKRIPFDDVYCFNDQML